MKIDRANPVFAPDTTHIPMVPAFVSLTAGGHWASRKIFTHRVAITLEASHAVEAPEEALTRYRLLDIVSAEIASPRGGAHPAALARSVRLSMDGKDAWRDNAFVARAGRSIKNEEGYLKAYVSVSPARRSIGDDIDLRGRKWPLRAWRIRHRMRHTRAAVRDQIGSMIASDVPLSNLSALSE